MTKIKKEETKISVITTNGTKQKRIRINIRILNKMLLLLILVQGFLYMAGTNELTSQGFRLMELKKQAKETMNENADLETQVTVLSSYNGLGEKVKTLGMVSVDKVSYIEVKDTVVAKK